MDTRTPTLPRNIAPPKSDAPLAQQHRYGRDQALAEVEDLQERLTIAQHELDQHESALIILRRRCGSCGTCAACVAERGVECVEVCS